MNPYCWLWITFWLTIDGFCLLTYNFHDLINGQWSWMLLDLDLRDKDVTLDQRVALDSIRHSCNVSPACQLCIISAWGRFWEGLAILWWLPVCYQILFGRPRGGRGPHQTICDNIWCDCCWSVWELLVSVKFEFDFKEIPLQSNIYEQLKLRHPIH